MSMILLWFKRSILILAIALFCASFILNSVLSFFNLYVNTTRSLPLGLYKAHFSASAPALHLFSFEVPTTELSFEANDLVLLCLDGEMAQLADDRGYIQHGKCPNETAPLGKHIVGVPGDTVAFSEKGIALNGHLLPLSRPFLYDAEGLALPHPSYEKTLAQDEYIMLNALATSFDSRYFGIISKKQIMAKLEPILTW